MRFSLFMILMAPLILQQPFCLAKKEGMLGTLGRDKKNQLSRVLENADLKKGKKTDVATQDDGPIFSDMTKNLFKGALMGAAVLVISYGAKKLYGWWKEQTLDGMSEEALLTEIRTISDALQLAVSCDIERIQALSSAQPSDLQQQLKALPEAERNQMLAMQQLMMQLATVSAEAQYKKLLTGKAQGYLPLLEHAAHVNELLKQANNLLNAADRRMEKLAEKRHAVLQVDQIDKNKKIEDQICLDCKEKLEKAGKINALKEAEIKPIHCRLKVETLDQLEILEQLEDELADAKMRLKNQALLASAAIALLTNTYDFSLEQAINKKSKLVAFNSLFIIPQIADEFDAFMKHFNG